MVAAGGQIHLIFDDSRREAAWRVTRWLTGEGRARVLEEEEGSLRFVANFPIAGDSAIVLISDEAVENPAWQRAVRAIGADVRVIPAGATENADYSDPDVIPPRIEEVHFIRIDEHLLDNLLDSLTTDPGFYTLKNRMMSLAQAWEASGRSDSFLLADAGQAGKSLALMQKKLENETDPYLIAQLEDIIEFLQHSRVYARQLLAGAVWRNAKRGAAALAAVAIVVLFLVVMPFLRRASYSSALVTAGLRADIAPVAAVRLVEGLTNPFVPGDAKREYFQDLVGYLDMNWPDSPLGAGYKWWLNDAAMTSDTGSVWTATGGGDLVRWDRASGGIVAEEAVSASPLAALAVTGGEEYFAAIDSEGYVFLKEGGGAWGRSEAPIDMPATRDLGMLLAPGGEAVAVHNSRDIFLLSGGATPRPEHHYSYDRVLSVQLEGGGALAAVVEGGRLKCLELAGGQVAREYPIPAEAHGTCPAVLREGRLLFAGPAGQLLLWDRQRPDRAEPLGLVLSQPLSLAWVDGATLAYHDRNTGTHLYDFEHQIDLGPCLTVLPALDRLQAHEGRLIAQANGMVYTEDVTSLLPRESVDEGAVLLSFEGQSDTGLDGALEEIAIVNEYIIRLTLAGDGGPQTVVVDGANRYFVGEAQRDEGLLAGIPEGYSYPSVSPVRFTGRPTVVGILDDGDCAVIGASDGSFFELRAAGDGLLVCSQRQIPSHSAVAAVLQAGDRYYLLDAEGLYWEARLGYRMETDADIIAAVRDKLNHAFDDELFSLVSPQVADALELERLPGADGEEWE